MPMPHFAPVSGGGIQLEWRRQNRELELEILPNGEIAFLKAPEPGEMEEGVLPLSFHADVFELVKWFEGNPANALICEPPGQPNRKRERDAKEMARQASILKMPQRK